MDVPRGRKRATDPAKYGSMVIIMVMAKLKLRSCLITSCAFLSLVILAIKAKNLLALWTVQSEQMDVPTIYAVTPTYARLVQKAELTRLTHTFLHLQHFHWIVVEDSANKTPLVTSLLQSSGLVFTHLCVKTERYSERSKGGMQRNLALSWLRETFMSARSVNGVVYFADDDNVYSLEVFKEMRDTKKVSVWPVAFVGGLRYESIKVDAAGKVKGWKVVFGRNRPFQIDMAGFAINLNLILQKRRAWFRLDIKRGHIESSLLQDLVTLEDLEPKADNCTKILVWHTKTQRPNARLDKGFTDLDVEV
ncbi:galactosylgalactosylxylosylprotein 3-beta-glucuronosyltransferase 1-like [Ambystoma mexicanum]|uniref:galactosylgalactosylxylosylprotein 3-beta-glucuronosyltransferase 1-like n=1 Tax=Ambystoma mexicanum TaxID=8296 RepID=UPI0037E79755